MADQSEEAAATAAGPEAETAAAEPASTTAAGAEAPDADAPQLPEGSGQWDRDMHKMREGLRLLLTNDLKGSEEFFTRCVEEAGARNRAAAQAEGEHDARGSFAFCGSYAALLRGVASLQSDQLATAVERLQVADSYTAGDTEWAGGKLTKGLCMLFIGILQTMQSKHARGIWNMLRSWLWLRTMEAEGLDYEGPERALVRSTTLLSLGLFNLMVSFLPPNRIKTAEWLSGFSGDRDKALEYMKNCWEEGGISAPFAALILLGYDVDVRTFLAEPRSTSSIEESKTFIRWADENYPGGIFFKGLEANFEACINKDLDLALRISDSMAPVAEEYPGLKFVANTRRATYAMANLEWAAAAASFRAAIDVYKNVGRRSVIPAMAINAAVCHKMDGHEEPAAEMFALVKEYKERKDKKNWELADKIAFSIVDELEGNKAAEDPKKWPYEYELFAHMILKHRCGHFMPAAKLEAFIELLKQAGEKYKEGHFNHYYASFLEAEVMRQAGNYEAAMPKAELVLQQEFANDAQGVRQYCLYIVAACYYYKGNLRDAKESLRQLSLASKNYIFEMVVSFKVTQLSRRLGMDMQDVYRELKVGARTRLNVVAEVPEGCGPVEWDFTLVGFTINFTATFQPDATDEAARPEEQELQYVEQHEAESGPVVGNFEPQGRGQLRLEFDNSFSLLRGKTMNVRVQPDSIKLVVLDK